MLIVKIREKFKKFVRLCRENPQDFKMWLFIILAPAVIVFFMDYMQRPNFEHPFFATFEWIFRFPVAFIINWLVVIALSLLVWLISKKVSIATIFVSSLMLIISGINYFKLTIRGEPVYPGDFLFPGEATNIAGATEFNFPSSIIFFGVAVIIICVLAFCIKTPRLSRKKRIKWGIAIIVISALSYPLYFANSTTQKIVGIEDAIWNQKYNYEKNGFLGAFLMQVKYLSVDKPDGYSKSAATKLLSSVNQSVAVASKPNIIVIMNESFWDPTRLPGVTFNIDPLESWRKVQTESVYGDLLVEPFGGNTANTEFEALTGFSMNALPGGVAYQQYIKRQTPTLASLLKDQGYATEAVHPYTPWFWNRQMVYPMMGIDKFLSEDSFVRSDFKGKYISDWAVGDKIISEFESNQATDKPFFAHIVTMQNHRWYNTDRYGTQQKVFATSDKLSDQTRLELDVYAQGAKDASDNIARLVAYFKTVSEPTIIVTFGDHLPSIGNDYGLYKDTGFVGDGSFSDSDNAKLHRLPFLIWSNTSSTSKDIGVINANYLMPIMLKNAGMEMSDYFSFLGAQMSGVQACSKLVCLDKDGSNIRKITGADRDKLTKQAILQYYYLFD